MTAGRDGSDGSPDDDLALLRAHEPVVRFTAGELFLPTAAGPYVERCGLWVAPVEGRDPPEPLVAQGGLTVDRLAELGRRHRDRALSLRFVAEPPDRATLRAWRREDRPRLRGGGRFAAVGVFTRTIDSLLRVSLLLRGRLLSFLVGLVLTVATVVALVVLVLGLLRNWQAVLGVLLTLAAVMLFAVNVRELRRG